MGNLCAACLLSGYREDRIEIDIHRLKDSVHEEDHHEEVHHEEVHHEETPHVPSSPSRRGLPPGTGTPLKQRRVSYDHKDALAVGRPARGTPRRRLYTTGRQDRVDLDILGGAEAKASSDPLGLYLLYDARNNGSWMLQWSKTYIDNAWGFCRPKDIAAVADYRFQPSKKDQLSIGIHSSKESMGLGILEFLKHARRQRGTFTLLPEYGRQITMNKDVFSPITIGLHGPEDNVVIVDSINPTVEDVSQFDAAVAIVGIGRGTAALNEMGLSGVRVPKSDFVGVGHSYGSGISFV